MKNDYQFFVKNYIAYIYIYITALKLYI